MSNSIKVKFQNHFKLYLLFKDKILFENELIKRDIEFYEDYMNQPGGDNVRYFLLDKNREIIDLILKEKEIIGNIETLPIIDFQQIRKIQYLYLKFAIFVIAIMVLIILFD